MKKGNPEYEQTISTEWYGMTYVGLHFIVKLINYIIMITGYGFHSHVDGTMAGIVSITRVSIHLLRSYYIHVSSFIIIYHHDRLAGVLHRGAHWLELPRWELQLSSTDLGLSTGPVKSGEIGWNRFWKRRLVVYIDESYIHTLHSSNM